MIDALVPSPIVRQLLMPRGIVSARAIAPGLSGARLFRCRDSAGVRLALRCWPPGTSSARIAEVHRVMRFARAGGCQLVPLLVGHDNPAIISHQQRHWELSQWMPGSPPGQQASLAQIRTGATAIAHFHHATAPLASHRQPAPAVISRLDRLAQVDPLLAETLPMGSRRTNADELSAAVEQARCLLVANWSAVRRRIAAALNRYASQSLDTQYVLRDVHRDHVLFDHDVVTGLIDYDAVRIDTPLTDLSRWIGSFHDVPWQQAHAAAMAGYFEDSPFSQSRPDPLDDELVTELCLATHWISLANWVIWVVVEQRQFPGGPRNAAKRIVELVRFCRSGKLGDLWQH